MAAKSKQGYDLPEISVAEAVKRLGKLAGLLEAQIDTVMKRKNWRDSEKAMSVMDLLNDVAACRKGAAMLIAKEDA